MSNAVEMLRDILGELDMRRSAMMVGNYAARSGERCGTYVSPARGYCSDPATMRWKTPDGYHYSCLSHMPWNPPFPMECWQPGEWVPYTVAEVTIADPAPAEPKVAPTRQDAQWLRELARAWFGDNSGPSRANGTMLLAIAYRIDAGLPPE